MADRVRAESRAITFFAPQRHALVHHLREKLGPDAYEAARSAGQAFSIGEIAAAALPDAPEPHGAVAAPGEVGWAPEAPEKLSSAHGVSTRQAPPTT